jgi:hypothetical protein
VVVAATYLLTLVILANPEYIKPVVTAGAEEIFPEMCGRILSRFLGLTPADSPSPGQDGDDHFLRPVFLSSALAVVNA